MNKRYRKARRLRTRHYRNGHTPWCRCPEPWQDFLIQLCWWADRNDIKSLRSANGYGGDR